MPSWLPPLLITAAALTIMYFTCMRPMRHGHCPMPRCSNCATRSLACVRTSIGHAWNETGQ